MDTLILGGTGLLGSNLRQFFHADGVSLHGGEGCGICDATKIDQLGEVVGDAHPTIVLNAAGIANADEAEKNPELSKAANVGIVENLVELQKKFSFQVVHVSTDYVFWSVRGGERLSETAERNAPSLLGKQKAVADSRVLSVEGNLVLRISSPFGGLRPPKKIQFFDAAVASLQKGESVRALVDQQVTPIYIPDFCRAVATLLEGGFSGDFNIAQSEVVSRWDFAKALAEVLGADSSLVIGARMEDFHWLAPRPFNSSLDNSKSIKAGVVYTPMREALNLAVEKVKRWTQG